MEKWFVNCFKFNVYINYEGKFLEDILSLFCEGSV